MQLMQFLTLGFECSITLLFFGQAATNALHFAKHTGVKSDTEVVSQFSLFWSWCRKIFAFCNAYYGKINSEVAFHSIRSFVKKNELTVKMLILSYLYYFSWKKVPFLYQLYKLIK